MRLAQPFTRAALERVGSLLLASNLDRLHSLQRKQARLRALGVRCELFTPAQVGKIAPHLRVDEDLVGALHLPDDCVIRQPLLLTRLLSELAQDKGSLLCPLLLCPLSPCFAQSVHVLLLTFIFARFENVFFPLSLYWVSIQYNKAFCYSYESNLYSYTRTILYIVICNTNILLSKM